MGMPVRIVLYARDEAAAIRAATAAFARIASLDRAMSDYRPDSEIRDLSRLSPAPVIVSQDVFRVVARAIAIARDTDGAFDPTVAPLVALWRDARTTGRLPARAAIDAARARTGWRRVELDAARSSIRLPDPGMRIDLGGIAVPETTSEVVLPVGTQNDLRGRFVYIANAALATSGPAAQFVQIDGVRYSHVVDPRTGWALTTSVTAHVIAADGATADALATAATVAGARGLDAIRARFPEARIYLVESVGGTAAVR